MKKILLPFLLLSSSLISSNDANLEDLEDAYSEGILECSMKPWELDLWKNMDDGGALDLLDDYTEYCLGDDLDDQIENVVISYVKGYSENALQAFNELDDVSKEVLRQRISLIRKMTSILAELEAIIK